METIKVYKLFRKGLRPLFIDTENQLPLGTWIDAKGIRPEILATLEEGYSMVHGDTCLVKMRNYPTASLLRSSWAVGGEWIKTVNGPRGRRQYVMGISSSGRVIPFAYRAGWHTCRTPDLPGVDMTGKVWAECLIPADSPVVHRNINGMTDKIHSVDWLIAKKILIIKTISHA